MAITFLNFSNNVQTSLNLLLNIIIQQYFKDSTCMLQFRLSSNITDYQFPIINDQSKQVVINPKECIPGCSHYIFHDFNLFYGYFPGETTWLRECFVNKGNYNFKGILFLENDTIENYRGDFTYFNSIFIKKQDDLFGIFGYKDEFLGGFIELNTWSIKEKRFLSNNTHLFNRWMNKEDTMKLLLFYFPSTSDIIPFHYYDVRYAPVHYGIEPNLIQEFANFLKQEFVLSMFLFLERPVFKGNLRTHEIMVKDPSSYPLAQMFHSFLVPKATVRRSWFSFFQVFQIDLLLFILATISFTVVYFFLRETLLRLWDQPAILSLYGLLLGQGLNNTEIPPGHGSRMVLMIYLVVCLLCSSMYASVVLREMLITKYEVIHNMHDLIQSDLPIVLNEHNTQAPTKTEMILQSRSYFLDSKDKSLLKGPRSTYAYEHFYTSLGFSNFMRKQYLLFIENMQHIDDYYKQSYSTLMVHYPETYTHLLPDLNDFILRCRESGLLDKWEWEVFLNTNTVFQILRYKDNNPEEVTIVALTLNHVAGVFICWAVCTLLTVLMFLWELFKEQRLFIDTSFL